MPRFSIGKLILFSELKNVALPTLISPEIGLTMPDNTLIKVVFPDPEGPNNTVAPVLGISNLISIRKSSRSTTNSALIIGLPQTLCPSGS